MQLEGQKTPADQMFQSPEVVTNFTIIEGELLDLAAQYPPNSPVRAILLQDVGELVSKRALSSMEPTVASASRTEQMPQKEESELMVMAKEAAKKAHLEGRALEEFLASVKHLEDTNFSNPDRPYVPHESAMTGLSKEPSPKAVGIQNRVPGDTDAFDTFGPTGFKKPVREDRSGDQAATLNLEPELYN